MDMYTLFEINRGFFLNKNIFFSKAEKNGSCVIKFKPEVCILTEKKNI